MANSNRLGIFMKGFVLFLLCLPLVFSFYAEAGEDGVRVSITKVIDGNTLLTSDGMELRLIDISLPKGKNAGEALVKHLQKRALGRRVSLQRDYRERDEDGALLVYIFVDGELLNAEILAKGLATMKHSTLNTRHQIELFKSQAAAYKAGYGIWVGRAPERGKKAGKITSSSAKGATSLKRPVEFERVEKDILITPERINNEAVEMAEKGDLKGAAVRWEEAAKLMPELFEASYNLARAKIELGLYDDAQELVEKLIKEKPEEAGLYTLLGMALLGQGKPEEAINMHKKALSLDPDLYEARLNIARTYEAVGNLQRALYEYDKIKKSAPDDPYLYLSIGSLYRSLGNEDKAMENFNKALEVSTDEAVSSAVRAKLEAFEAEKGLSKDALSEKLAPAIVQVQAVKIVPHPQFPQTRTIRQTNAGAGFIVGGRGEVITSAKLISEAAEITVKFYDPVSGTLGQTAYPAEVAVTGRIPSANEVPFLDFTLLKMTSPPRGLQALELGDSSSVSIDDVVYTMGYPGGKEHKLLKGTVTEVRDMPGSEQQRITLLKRYPAIKASPVKSVKLLVNDLGMDEQLSGAPMVNNRGQVIGVNVVELQGYEGESVALDIDSVRRALQR